MTAPDPRCWCSPAFRAVAASHGVTNGHEVGCPLMASPKPDDPYARGKADGIAVARDAFAEALNAESDKNRDLARARPTDPNMSTIYMARAAAFGRAIEIVGITKVGP